MTLQQIMIRHERAGKHFFSKDAMRFFKSRVSVNVHTGPGGIFIVTSERFDWNSPRLYTVRKVSEDCSDVSTVGEFQGYRTSAAAHKEAERLAKGETNLSA